MFDACMDAFDVFNFIFDIFIDMPNLFDILFVQMCFGHALGEGGGQSWSLREKGGSVLVLEAIFVIVPGARRGSVLVSTGVC